MLHSATDVRLIQFPRHTEENGDLVAIEGLSHIPFAIARVFVVRASAGSIRGRHAHIECSQFLTCSNGTVEVQCDDGTHTVAHTLDQPGVGLLLPPSIWSTQIYRSINAVLTVLCDRVYDAGDYIRDYEEYRQFRGLARFA